MENNNNYCVILAGGIGTTFWPLSKRNLPKQFIDILGNGKSTLRLTYERTLKYFDNQNIIVVTNENYFDLTKNALPEVLSANIFCEPLIKNTAIAVAYSYNKIKKINPEAKILFTPSDHIVKNEDLFVDSISKAFEFIDSKDMVLAFGSKPTFPHIGFGYIQYTPNEDSTYKKVKTFVEKPNIQMARLFIDNGEFLWNLGMFLANVNALDNAYKTYMPDVHANFANIYDKLGTDQENDALHDVYPLCPKISIDYALIEKMKNICVSVVDFEWTDLGTWSALYDLTKKDKDENAVCSPKTLLINSENCVVNSLSKKIIVAKGLKNYIVAESNDAILIMPKEDENKITEILNSINVNFGKEYL